MFTGAVERWTEAGRPRYIGCNRNAEQPGRWQQCSSVELVECRQRLYEAAIDAYGALISGVIPAAWITEALFTKFYNAFIRRRGDPSAQTFLLGFDSMPIQAEKTLYDLAEWVRSPRRAGRLPGQHARRAARCSSLNSGPGAARMWTPSDWQEWQTRFRAHLQRYGHTIYDLDFANPVPADDPTPLLETFQLFIGGQGVNPHTRQLARSERREQASRPSSNRLKGWRLKYFRKYLAHGAALCPAARRRAGGCWPGLSPAAPDAARAGPPLHRGRV